MKKIIFFLVVSICSFISNYQIPGVVDYFPGKGIYLDCYWCGQLNEKTLGFGTYCGVGDRNVELTFEQEDNYTVTGNSSLMYDDVVMY